MSSPPPARPAKLEVEGLTVRFGGLVAVNGVTLSAAPGVITGLIGPNGAGKTTIFNACTGVVKAQAGTVLLDGQRLDRSSVFRRAQLGLGRTFQRMELFDRSTVLENVSMGLESRQAGRRWWAQLGATPGERAASLAAAEEAMTLCGITDLANRLAGDLATGQRRLVELARAITGRFRFLLLDEPSSGLDESETLEFAEILTAIAERDGTGILLVEHDMTLVRKVCRYIYVLDFGQLIYEGEASEVLSADVVRAAYLGTEEVAV